MIEDVKEAHEGVENAEDGGDLREMRSAPASLGNEGLRTSGCPSTHGKNEEMVRHPIGVVEEARERLELSFARCLELANSASAEMVSSKSSGRAGKEHEDSRRVVDERNTEQEDLDTVMQSNHEQSPGDEEGGASREGLCDDIKHTFG